LAKIAKCNACQGFPLYSIFVLLASTLPYTKRQRGYDDTWNAYIPSVGVIIIEPEVLGSCIERVNT